MVTLCATLAAWVSAPGAQTHGEPAVAWQTLASADVDSAAVAVSVSAGLSVFGGAFSQSPAGGTRGLALRANGEWRAPGAGWTDLSVTHVAHDKAADVVFAAGERVVQRLDASGVATLPSLPFIVTALYWDPINRSLVAGGHGRVARWGGLSWNVETVPATSVVGFATRPADGRLFAVSSNSSETTEGLLQRTDTGWVRIPGLGSGWTQAVLWHPGVQGIAVVGQYAHPQLGNPSQVRVWDGGAWTTALIAPAGTRLSGARWDDAGARLLLSDGQRIGIATGGSLSTSSALSSGLSGLQTAFDVDPGTGHIVAAGRLEIAGRPGEVRLARWDGTAWTSLDAGIVDLSDRGAVAVDAGSGAVFFGGEFDHVGPTRVDGLARYHDGTWSRVGNPVYGGTPSIPFDMAYLPGSRTLVHVGFVRSDRSIALSLHQNGQWQRLSWPVSGQCGGGVAVDPNAGDLFAGCGNQVFAYRGGVWQPVGSALPNTVEAMAFDPVQRRVLVAVAGSAGGSGRAVDLFALAANGSRTLLGTALTALGPGTGRIIESIAVQPRSGAVVIVGHFESVSGVAARNIALLTGSVWQPLSSGADAPVHEAAWSGDGRSLAISGPFGVAGGVPARGFAIWSAGVWLRSGSPVSGWVGRSAGDPARGGFAVFGQFGISRTQSASAALLAIDSRAPQWPAASVQDAVVTEGGAEGALATVRITLDGPAPEGAFVDWRTEPGSALAGLDFVAAAGRARFAAGSTSTEVSVAIIGDSLAENDETLAVRIEAVGSLTPGRTPGTVTIIDDDPAEAVAFAIRPDSARLGRRSTGYFLDVLANDVVDRGALRGGRLSVVEASEDLRAVVWSFVPDDNDAGNDRISVMVSANARPGPLRLRYRLCRADATCGEADVAISHGPLPGVLDVPATAPTTGTRPLEYVEMPAARDGFFEAYGLVRASPRVVDVPADRVGAGPWSAGSAVAVFSTLRGSEDNRRWRTFVDARRVAGASVADLHLGIDRNGDGIAQPEERVCSGTVSASNGPLAPRCALALEAPEQRTVTYWIVVHDRSGVAGSVRLESFDVPLDVPSSGRTLRATGPSVSLAGAVAAPLVGWDRRAVLPGQVTGGWVRFVSAQAGVDVWDAVRLEPAPVAADTQALAPGVPVTHALAQDGRPRYFIVDVPPGHSALDVTAAGEGQVSARLLRAPPLASVAEAPVLAAAPVGAEAVMSTRSVAGTSTLRIAHPPEGRYWVELVNIGAEPFAARLLATLEGAGSAWRSGSFFNPARSGHGLFIYPAGFDLAGIWYAYDAAGQPTWYYLQGPAPVGVSTWRAALYRSVWLESRNRLTAVGEAVFTPTRDGGLVFTFDLDGRTGSERLVPFGSGCPRVAERVVDASGHWFDPRRAGTGYSSQFFPDYEFHAVFHYDASGMPRFLAAEGPAPLGADRSLALVQLSGFCPQCERVGAPTRRSVGTLLRTLADGRLIGMAPRFAFATPLSGTVDSADAVQPLGLTQGCPQPR